MLLKGEYQSLLSLLSRVRLEGIAEAKTVVQLEQKLEQRLATWFDGHITGFNWEQLEKDTEKLL